MEKMPILALMYDFDHTLSPRDMQEYAFIPELNMESDDFWALCRSAGNRYRMDPILAYMYVMLQEARKRGMTLTRDTFTQQGAHVELFDGLDTWFKRVNDYGASLGFKVEHYVLSSGQKEIIEGTPIASEFKEIYAASFCSCTAVCPSVTNTISPSTSLRRVVTLCFSSSCRVSL